MKKIILVVSILITCLFLVGCANKDYLSEKEITCPANCMSLCNSYNMTYIPSKVSITQNSCKMNCICSKVIGYDFN